MIKLMRVSVHMNFYICAYNAIAAGYLEKDSQVKTPLNNVHMADAWAAIVASTLASDALERFDEACGGSGRFISWGLEVNSSAELEIASKTTS